MTVQPSPHRRGRRVALKADARNRAWRTFLQGLAIDLAVAVAVLLYSVTQDDGPIVWAVVGASLLRTVVQTAAAYVMRAFADGRVPTPLPPTPQPAPADPT